MYQTGKTIKETLGQIEDNELVLPAIQREFVWNGNQVCRLFDSIMQGYPFGAFLYWDIKAKNNNNIKYYDFVLNYHQRDNPRCEPLEVKPGQKLTAVLDGQQRLTALNIGLRGSMAWKLQHKRWINSDAFPVRKLYLDLLWQPYGDGYEDEDNEMKYRFRFMTVDQLKQADDKVCWFPVKGILDMEHSGNVHDWLIDNLSTAEQKIASRPLSRLFDIVHTEKMLAYYEERDDDIDKVLQVFIRTNSGGTILSYSDLLLSVAVAQWKSYDAREVINELVDELNSIGNGFSFSKDLVMKAGLVLSDIANVEFSAKNFNRQNSGTLEDNWGKIKHALMLTVELVSSFGFDQRVLRSHNSILPIAYYLYVKNPGDGYQICGETKKDREAIREWLIRSLLKSGVWGSGVDRLLPALRQIIRENHDDGFPVDKIYAEMSRRSKNLSFGDEEIEDLVDIRHSDPLAFGLLSLLFPSDDLSEGLHVDHIFPKSEFTRTRLISAGVPGDKIDEFIQHSNRLANLQLLPKKDNLEKNNKMPAGWLAEAYKDSTCRRAYQEYHMLGEVPCLMIEFGEFYEARRKRLKARIKQLLGMQDSP